MAGEYEQTFFPLLRLPLNTWTRLVVAGEVNELNTSYAKSGQLPRESALVKNGKPYFLLIKNDNPPPQDLWIACAKESTIGPEFAGRGKHYPIRRTPVILARVDEISSYSLRDLSDEQRDKLIRGIIVNEGIDKHIGNIWGSVVKITPPAP